MDLFDFANKNDPPVAEPVSQETTATVLMVIRYKPFIDSDGGLVVPFTSDKKYHWWAGGQSAEETLKEITND